MLESCEGHATVTFEEEAPGAGWALPRGANGRSGNGRPVSRCDRSERELHKSTDDAAAAVRHAGGAAPNGMSG